MTCKCVGTVHGSDHNCPKNPGQPRFPSPNGKEPECKSCDDKGCGFCVTGDSLAAWFPKD